MNYVLYHNGQVVGVTTESPFTGTSKFKEIPGVTYNQVKTAGDYKSFPEVEVVAAILTQLTGETYLAFDNGEHTSHRFGVARAPKVGDNVSYGFNGDYYPCGKIVRITKGWRIYTEDASKPEGARRQKCTFNRRKQTSSWLMVGGTWSLVNGIVDERNPHF